MEQPRETENVSPNGTILSYATNNDSKGIRVGGDLPKDVELQIEVRPQLLLDGSEPQNLQLRLKHHDVFLFPQLHGHLLGALLSHLPRVFTLQNTTCK